MSLEGNLKVIKDAKLDIELLRRQNEKLCEENNKKISEFETIIKVEEEDLERELRLSGEKKLECKLGWCSYRVMPDKWEYDDEKILLWCKDFKKPYYYTKEIVRRIDIKNDINLYLLKLEDVPGVTVTPQNPKFNYKINGGI